MSVRGPPQHTMSAVLVIGNKNYSSWSLRAWLLLREAGIAFEERRIALDQPDTKAALHAVSSAGRVPVLLLDGEIIWDSLAIAETLAERHPGNGCGRSMPQPVRMPAASARKCTPASPRCATRCQ